LSSRFAANGASQAASHSSPSEERAFPPDISLLMAGTWHGRLTSFVSASTSFVSVNRRRGLQRLRKDRGGSYISVLHRSLLYSLRVQDGTILYHTSRPRILLSIQCLRRSAGPVPFWHRIRTELYSTQFSSIQPVIKQLRKSYRNTGGRGG